MLLQHGERAPFSAVLLHGLTNNPAQFTQFAPLLYERGVNVFVPRMPEHGARNRLTKRPAQLTAEALLCAANEAVDIACGLGERVGVLGISVGASITAYFAQFRDVAIAVPVAPVFAILRLPFAANRLVERVGLLLPNRFLWWNPWARESQPPASAYPRFSTRALMQSLRIGDEVYFAALSQPPRASRIVTIVNRSDPAVNNRVTRRISEAWTRSNPDGVAYIELAGLPRLHDIIDPQQPHGCTELVYPRLLEALGFP